MAKKITELRVVLASPSDVKRERESFAQVVDQVNRDTARPNGLHLDLRRWETDANPGFNPRGPQGLIDKVLHIEQSDLFVGIFWNRIGTAMRSGKTGTEHEFAKAYRAWKRRRVPEMMFYFCEKPSHLTSEEALDQRRRVLGFRAAFPEEGLYWTYSGHAQFVKHTNEHLRRFVHEHVKRATVSRPGHNIAKQDELFSLKIGKGGQVILPPALLNSLGLHPGDSLELRLRAGRVAGGRPVGSLPGTSTTSRLLKRVNSEGVDWKPSEF